MCTLSWFKFRAPACGAAASSSSSGPTPRQAVGPSRNTVRHGRWRVGFLRMIAGHLRQAVLRQPECDATDPGPVEDCGWLRRVWLAHGIHFAPSEIERLVRAERRSPSAHAAIRRSASRGRGTNHPRFVSCDELTNCDAFFLYRQIKFSCRLRKPILEPCRRGTSALAQVGEFFPRQPRHKDERSGIAFAARETAPGKCTSLRRGQNLGMAYRGPADHIS